MITFHRVISRSKDSEMTINGNNLPTKLLKKASGEVYLTTRRFIFLCNDNKDLHSFSGDFPSISNIEVIHGCDIYLSLII